MARQADAIIDVLVRRFAGDVPAAAARRVKAPALLRPSKAQRQAALRQKARSILAADDWKVYFKGLRRLNTIRNERSRMGFDLFGDPDVFRR